MRSLLLVIPVPPGRSMRQDSAPTVSQISRHYETNDVSAAEDLTAFALRECKVWGHNEEHEIPTM